MLPATLASLALLSTSSVQPAYDLLERTLPGSSSHFALRIGGAPGDKKCFVVDDAEASGKISIVGDDLSTLTAGIGWYLRERVNLTVGWRRGGGSRLFAPSPWPSVGGPARRCRTVPHSYFMNVCTHSYSLVWYGWAEWQALLDWMALSGINLFLALTGQEEVQYRTFRKFGLADGEIRSWFNGPAFLTWSRGQNEYGAGIAGPLPRSFMLSQYELQKKILARSRALGIVGELPAFQGNVPIGMKAALKDENISTQGATGWMDSLDPNFGQIADAWMAELTASFGTDHWYQLDGYFNGGTAPWYRAEGRAAAAASAASAAGSRPSLDAYVVGDPTWKRRGEAAYAGVNRTDPDAVWSLQGFAFSNWDQRNNSAELATHVKGFIDAVPREKLVIIDMGYSPQWLMWNRSAWWGAKFIWTALHDFGGTDGIKGNLTAAAAIPAAALPSGGVSTGVVGSGMTMEGIDQNPAFYDFLLDGQWEGGAPIGEGIADRMVRRALRRYGLAGSGASPAAVKSVAAAWTLLVSSLYSQRHSVQDQTGVAHFGTHRLDDYGDLDPWSWEADRRTPVPKMCQVWQAWGHMLDAVDEMTASGGGQRRPTAELGEPLVYDLVNLGREVLAQISTPTAQNFSDALLAQPLVPSAIESTGAASLDLLADLDTLLATDEAFLLAPWIKMARDLALSVNGSDCTPAKGVPPEVSGCAHFYEWNARCQLTSWNPVPHGAARVPAGPDDYAAKHWAGLVRGFYHRRTLAMLARARVDAAASRPLDLDAFAAAVAQTTYDFQVSTEDAGPAAPVGDAPEVSRAMWKKYSPRFATCA